MYRARRFAVLGGLLLTTVALAATLKSYLTIDYDDHYLLSAHLAAGLLYVIDLRPIRS